MRFALREQNGEWKPSYCYGLVQAIDLLLRLKL
jgi:hypothetical protein